MWTYEEHLPTQIPRAFVDHIRNNHTNNTIPEPIACCTQRNALRPNRQLENLSNNDPCRRAPCAGEEEHVQADEDDEAVIRCVLLFVDGPDGRDNELADGHGQRAVDEEGPAAVALDGVEGDGRAADVDDGRDHGDEEGVLQADGVEECRVVTFHTSVCETLKIVKFTH